MKLFIKCVDGKLRNVILHMHFPKTGGSTFNSILNREFGKKHYALSFFKPKNNAKFHNSNICWSDVGGTHEISELTPVWEFDATDIFDMLEYNKDAIAVSRHGIFLEHTNLNADNNEFDGTNNIKDFRSKKYNIFPIFFLRKILFWHMSLYFQQRRDPEYMVRSSYDPRVIVAKTGNLREYTQFCVDHANDLDYHKIMFNWTEYAIDMMVRHIKLYQIGITERYNESLVVMEQKLAKYFPGIDLSYSTWINVDENRRTNTEMQNMSELKKWIGEELVEKFTTSYPQSTKLYNIINAELDNRISCIPDFGQKMDNFERRCQRRALAKRE
ncbi:MAG: hypothetical protein EB828_02890 [Nitrosopumilus sp. D6]|nr:MAG: hypothetical protein EB828_02890 [Nitrosopumilus sp. D6]